MTIEECKKFILNNQKLSTKDIAKATGYNENNIRYYKRMLGLGKTRKELHNQKEEKIKFIRDNLHLSTLELSKLLGVSRKRMSEILSKYGINKGIQQKAKENKEIILENYKDKSNEELASITGLSIQQVKTIKHKLGLENKQQEISEQKLKNIEFLRSNYKNYSDKELAKMLNLSEDYIGELLSKNGLIRRERVILLEDEIFKELDCIGFPNYSVSNKGRVKNIRKELLHPSTTSDGYLMVVLYNKDCNKTYCVHNLVALMFLPTNDDPTNKTEIDHIDGNKKNNCSSNLEYVSHYENMQRAKKNGLLKTKSCEDSPVSKFTNIEVEEICKLFEQGMRVTEVWNKLEKKFNRATLYNIFHRKTWTGISKKYKF